MKTKIFLLILISFLFFSCATTKIINDNNLRSKIVGSWSGTETGNQKEGLTKYWISNYNKNGSFIILFTSIENCEVESHIEKGKWRIKEGLVYLTYDFDGKTDVYAFELIDDDNIKFKSKELSLEFNNKEYEFIETREK